MVCVGCGEWQVAARDARCGPQRKQRAGHPGDIQDKISDTAIRDFYGPCTDIADMGNLDEGAVANAFGKLSGRNFCCDAPRPVLWF
ncbi:hypothetical protein D9X30_5921 [Cupriavidus sp. U2]|nr:hypothetical protein D9X30_5921 [Cupriavidus sp. U2]